MSEHNQPPDPQAAAGRAENSSGHSFVSVDIYDQTYHLSGPDPAQVQQIITSELQRTQQTAAPLAEMLHLKPVAIPIAKPEDVVAAVRASTARNVLVVWHDQTLPGILRALGAPEITPIAHTEYDRFFVLTLSGKGKESKVVLVLALLLSVAS